MAPALNRTHELCCEAFGGPLASLVELVGPAATTAIVRVDADELDAPPDGDACRRTWRSVRQQVERVPAEDGAASTAWRWDPTSDAGRAALLDLLSLTDGGAGAYFVRDLELRADGGVLLAAVPHHLDAGVDATLCGSQLACEEILDVPGDAACLVPTETDAEWVADNRRWTLTGGTLRVERRDGRRASCYGLTNLRKAAVADDGTLELAWDGGTVADDGIGRALTWVMDRFYSPPTSVPCPDRTRAEAVRERMQEILAAYDGREL